MMHKNKLPGMAGDEKTILFLRRHPFVLVLSTAGFFLLALIPAILYYLNNRFNPSFELGAIGFTLVLIGLSIFYLGILVFIFNIFLDYYLDVWIVTNHRVINIEQKNLFNRVISEQALFRIQDVTGEQKGILPTFLGYGTIFIQTAGEQQRFVFKEVPGPFKNAKKIQELALRDKEMHNISETIVP